MKVCTSSVYDLLFYIDLVPPSISFNRILYLEKVILTYESSSTTCSTSHMIYDIFHVRSTNGEEFQIFYGLFKTFIY